MAAWETKSKPKTTHTVWVCFLFFRKIWINSPEKQMKNKN